MSYKRIVFLFVFGLVAVRSVRAQVDAASKGKRDKTLIVFFDGLRPDYITKEVMPNLYAFKQQACYGTQHHSVFPTVTRVNAASYSSGSYPATHGLMNNMVYFPKVNRSKAMDSGNGEELQKINDATGGHLLTATTLGEILQAAGEKMMVFSSGTTGQALLQNHTVSGGAVINPGMILPASFAPGVIKALGEPAAYLKPNTGRHVWITNAFMKYGLPSDGPLVSAVWFSDPDGSAHAFGMGSKVALEALSSVDHEFGRIIDTLRATGALTHYNILISTDHGFVTYEKKESISGMLIREGLKKDAQSEDVILAEGAIYVRDHDSSVIRRIVERLQATSYAGAIFTKADKPGSMMGNVPGTLSFESIHWNHPERAADVLVTGVWNDNKNEAGFAGACTLADMPPGFSPELATKIAAGHGGSSPYEVHIPLMASGPAFRKATESNLPTSNIDIVPTVLYLYHLPRPATMDGRPLTELMADEKPAALKPVTKVIETKTSYPGGVYTLKMEVTEIGKYRYINYAQATR